MRYVPTLETNAYDVTQSYRLGTLITVNGKIYQSINDVPANTPITNTNYWLLLSEDPRLSLIPQLITKNITTASVISQVMTATTGITITRVIFALYGNICFLNIQFESNSDINAGLRRVLATMSSDFTPVYKAFGGDRDTIANINTGDKNINYQRITQKITAGTAYTISFMMVVSDTVANNIKTLNV